MTSLLVIAKQFWPEGGGAELATYLIVKNILSKNFNVIVVSGTKNPQPSIFKHCKYLYWPILKTKYKPLEWIKLFTNLRAIRKLIERADIVYIPSHTLLPLAVVAKHLNPRVNVALHLHNYQLLTYTSIVLADKEPNLATDIIVELGEHHSLARAVASGILYPLNKVNLLALRHADRVICVSKKQLKILVERIPWLKEKATVIYNPPPPTSLRPIEKRLTNKPKLLYLGGGSYVKGFHLILKATSPIIKTRRDIVFYIAGELRGNEIRLLNKLPRSTRNNVVTLGKISHKEAITIYHYTWALLFPSICEEPLPYTVVEASLTGTIPIATKVGGIPELLGDTVVRKFLFKPHDYVGLMSKVEELIAMDKHEIIELGYDVKSKVSAKLKTSAKKFLKIFEKLQI